MECDNHPDKEAIATCSVCGKAVEKNEIKRLEKPTVIKLVEMYKNLPNDTYKEIRPICERLVHNGAITLR